MLNCLDINLTSDRKPSIMSSAFAFGVFLASTSASSTLNISGFMISEKRIDFFQLAKETKNDLCKL
jgi:hypothetical protein